MLTTRDINTIEADEDATPEDYYCALQRAINDGSAWKFQGSYGRAMMAALESGRCILGTKPASDYWGNRIPSRTEVKAGTKGSPEFVERLHGAEWREMVESV